MNHSEKVNCIKAIIQLKRQEEYLEKDIDNFLGRMKVNADVMKDIIETRDQLSIERNKILNPFYCTSQNIVNNFEEIQLNLNNIEKGQKIDGEIMKVKLLTLTKKMKEFKLDSELEALVNEEKEIEEILQDFTININKYEKSMQTGGKCQKHSVHKNSDKLVDFGEIDNFNDLIVKTGHTDHWKEEDHLFFLKIRKKSKSIAMMVTEIQKKLPDLSIQQIINHEAWYKIYLDLREKQRKSVENWRKKKEMEKSIQIVSLKSHEEKKNDKVSENFENKQTNKYTEIEHDNTLKIMEKTKNNVIQEQNEKKEMIRKWKIQREIAKKADEERLKNQIDTIRSWKEQKFLLRSIEMKVALDEYKNKKILTKSTENEEKKNNCKIIRSSTLVKSFRQKDENYLRTRKSLIASKTQKKNMHNKIGNIDGVSSPRSPSASTLLKPTKIWKMRCKEKSIQESSSKELLYIKNLPRISSFNGKNQESNICF